MSTKLNICGAELLKNDCTNRILKSCARDFTFVINVYTLMEVVTVTANLSRDYLLENFCSASD